MLLHSWGAEAQVAVVQGSIRPSEVCNLGGPLPLDCLLLSYLCVAALVHVKAAVHIIFLINIQVFLSATQKMVETALHHPSDWHAYVKKILPKCNGQWELYS